MCAESLSLAQLKSEPLLCQLQDLEACTLELAAAAALDKRRYPVLNDPEWSAQVLQRVSADASLIVIGQVSSGKSALGAAAHPLRTRGLGSCPFDIAISPAAGQSF